MYPKIEMFIMKSDHYEIQIKRRDNQAIGTDELYTALEDTMKKYFQRPTLEDYINHQRKVINARKDIEHQACQQKIETEKVTIKPRWFKIDRSKYPEIVKARQAGMTTKELASKYKVTEQTIYNIVKASGKSIPEHRGRQSKNHKKRIELNQATE